MCFTKRYVHIYHKERIVYYLIVLINISLFFKQKDFLCMKKVYTIANFGANTISFFTVLQLSVCSNLKKGDPLLLMFLFYRSYALYEKVVIHLFL
jgi:hypothetical protein